MERPNQLRNSIAGGNAQVHQATGVIVAQTCTTPEDALSRLVGYAVDADISVDQAAADVIASKVSFI